AANTRRLGDHAGGALDAVIEFPATTIGIVVTTRCWSLGRAISHYDCLDFSTLASLPVSKIAADGSALFLWTTDPLLPSAIKLINSWATGRHEAQSLTSRHFSQKGSILSRLKC